MDYIKNSILDNNGLNKLISIPLKFNWVECGRYAISSMAKEAADLWEEGLTIQEIYKYLGVKKDTVTQFLKKAKYLNMCSYTKEEALKRRNILFSRLADRKYSEIAFKVAELWNDNSTLYSV